MSRKWIIWFLVSVFYAYQYILRVLPSVFLPDITKQFNLSSEIFGQFSGIYYIGYAFMHLPLGILLDWYGPRRILPLFILMTVMGTLPLIFTDIWYYPIIGRVFVGIGSSAAILGVFKIIRTFFPPTQFARMLSFSVTIGLIGAIYGGGPLHLARIQFGYTQVISAITIFGIVLSALFWFLIPETKTKQQTFSMNKILSSIQSVLTTKGVISLCLLSGLMVGPLEGFADVWGARFLKLVYGFSDTTSASLPSIIFLGMCFGGPVLSFIAETTKRPLWIIFSSALIMAVGFLILMTGQVSISQISCLFVIIGICCAYQILAIDQVSKQVSSDHTGIATSLANMIIMAFGYLFHGAIGLIIGALSQKGIEANQINSTTLTWGISIIPVALILSSIGIIGIARKKF